MESTYKLVQVFEFLSNCVYNTWTSLRLLIFIKCWGRLLKGGLALTLG
jgi:hypothetical protein